MTGLERKAHRLVKLARSGDNPSAAQLLSLHGAVAAHIAAEGALAASGAKAAVTVARTSSVYLKGLVAAAAIVTGAASFFSRQEGSSAPAPAPILRAVAPRFALPMPTRSTPEESNVTVSTEPSAPAPRAQKPASGLRLKEEAALLAAVQRALRSGQASTALAKLESYDRRFPTGMLRAEADAARVFALCGAGRIDRARASAARFVARFPSSPAAARVQAACN